jgi:hypothetical protein
MKKRSGSRKETKTEEGRGSLIIRQKIIDRHGLRPTPNVCHLVDPLVLITNILYTSQSTGTELTRALVN